VFREGEQATYKKCNSCLCFHARAVEPVWASADATIPEAAEQAPEQPLTHLLKHCRLGYHSSHGRGHSSRGGNGNSPPLSVPIVTRRRSLENYTKGANGELIHDGRGGGGGGGVGTFIKANANAGPSGLSKSDNNVVREYHHSAGWE
jgi:hypothetical protein